MTHEASAACRNCGGGFGSEPPQFCAHCGQETRLHPPRLGEFIHEFVGHYVALEGALWRTLGSLLVRPGRLTSEYLDGRRRRYVLPLRLYLSASFLFFLLVKVAGLGHWMPLQVGVGVDQQGRRLTSAELSHELADLRRCEAPAAAVCTWVERRVARLLADVEAGVPVAQQLTQRVAAQAPYAMFLLLPAFAGFVALAYRRRGLPYGAHFVFSLHMHSFWFLALLVAALVPAADEVVLGGSMLYATVALRRVYGGRWPATLARAGLIGGLYGATLLVTTAALAVLALAA